MRQKPLQWGGKKMTHQHSIVWHCCSLAACMPPSTTWSHSWLFLLLFLDRVNARVTDLGRRGIMHQEASDLVCYVQRPCWLWFTACPHMLQLLLLCPRGEHDSCWCTAQARAVTSPLLGCLHKLSPHPLFTASLSLQTPSTTFTVAGSTDTEEIQLCSLDVSKQLWGMFCTSGGAAPGIYIYIYIYVSVL